VRKVLFEGLKRPKSRKIPLTFAAEFAMKAVIVTARSNRRMIMNCRFAVFIGKTIFLAGVVATVVALQAQAQTVTLNNGNSSASIDLTSGDHTGMNNWTVDGINQLAQQWFWYRIGGATNQTIDTVGNLNFSTPNPNVLFSTYHNNQFSVEVDYTLTGGALGSHGSDINESIRVTNLTATSLDFHLYQFSHYTLGGIVGGATATLQKNALAKYIGAFESNATIEFNETVATPGGSLGEANLSAATLLSELNSGPYALNGNLTAGPGDVGYALEWDVSIAAGDGFVIGKDKSISPVPEPTTLGLLSVGLAALAWRKRHC
jgi:hypothetical protein